jgi:hypothetical protein
MDRIHYAGDSILTGTAIAAALLEYAAALARADASETVRIPTREEDGSEGRSTLLIGPASQLTADSEESEFDELVDEQLVARFKAEADLVMRKKYPRPVAAHSDDRSEADPEADWTDQI